MWFTRRVLRRLQNLFSSESAYSWYLVVVIQEAQSCSTVLVSINAHHGLGGSCQWVLQKWFPGFILCGKGATLTTIAWLVLEDKDRTLTVGREFHMRLCTKKLLRGSWHPPEHCKFLWKFVDEAVTSPYGGGSLTFIDFRINWLLLTDLTQVCKANTNNHSHAQNRQTGYKSKR